MPTPRVALCNWKAGMLDLPAGCNTETVCILVGYRQNVSWFRHIGTLGWNMQIMAFSRSYSNLQVQKESIQLYPPSTIFLSQEFKHVNWWPSKRLCCFPCNPIKKNIEGTLPKNAPLSSLVTWKVDEKNSNIEFWNEFHKVKWLHQSTLNSQQIGHKASDFFHKKEAFHIFSSFLRSHVETFHKSTSQQENV